MSRTTYPDEIIKQGAMLREQGLTWKQVAIELGGTEHSWRGLIARRAELAEQNNPDPYNKGSIARTRRRHKSSCPYPAHTCDSSWWLAGWNDRDMEIG